MVRSSDSYLINFQLAVFVKMNSIFFALCILANFPSDGANEIYGTGNIACLSNTRVILTCRAPEIDFLYVDWAHQGRNTSSAHPLTNNTESINSTNYLMTKIENQESLIMDSVQLQDAGIYYCIKINTSGDSTEIGNHLIVIASDPICNLENVTVMENDYIRLQCSVSYNGLWRPVMEWTQIDSFGQEKLNNDSVLVNITEVPRYINQTVYLQIVASQYHNNIVFVCYTYFNFSDAEFKGKLASNSSPDYNHTWKSPNINVLYGPRNVSINPARDILYPGDTLTCSAFGNPKPECSCVDEETFDNEKIASQIEITNSMIRDHPYVFGCRAHNSVSKSFSSFTFTVRRRFPLIYIAIVVIWLLCTLLLTAIICVVRKYMRDRRERSYANNAIPASRDVRNEINGHLVLNERIGVLNGNGYDEYRPNDLRAIQPRNETINLDRAHAAERCADCHEENNSKQVGADGTEYVQMNLRPDNQAPAASPAVRQSTVQLSNYASIDHTRKVPKRRK